MYWRSDGWRSVDETDREPYLDRLLPDRRQLGDVLECHRREIGCWPPLPPGHGPRAWLVEVRARPAPLGLPDLRHVLFQDIRLYLLDIGWVLGDGRVERERIPITWADTSVFQGIWARMAKEAGGPLPADATTDPAEYAQLVYGLLGSGLASGDQTSVGMPYLLVDAGPAGVDAVSRTEGGRQPVSLRLGSPAPKAAVPEPAPANGRLTLWIDTAAQPATEPAFDRRSRFDLTDSSPPAPALTTLPDVTPAPEARAPVRMLWRHPEAVGQAASCDIALSVDPLDGRVDVEQIGEVGTPAPCHAWRLVWLAAFRRRALVRLGPRLRLEGGELLRELKRREERTGTGPGAAIEAAQAVPAAGAGAAVQAAQAADAAGRGGPDPADRAGRLSRCVEQLAEQPVWTNLEIEGDLNLSGVHWTQALPRCHEVDFLGDVRLESARIDHDLRFSRCCFTGRLDGTHARIGGDLKIDECTIEGDVRGLAGLHGSSLAGRSLPALDLTGAEVGGSIMLLLSHVYGILCMAGVRVRGKLLLKGVLQRPRPHDARRVQWYHGNTGLAETIFAMVDLRHAQVEQAIDFGPARLSTQPGRAHRPAASRSTADPLQAPVPDGHSLYWRRSQFAGSLRLDHAHTPHLNLAGVAILDSAYRVGGDPADAPAQQISQASCHLDHAQVDGVVEAGEFVERWSDDEQGVAVINAFRFTACRLSAEGLRCHTLSIGGARILQDVSLTGMEVELLLGEAGRACRLQVGGELGIADSRIGLARLDGARLGRLFIDETTIAASLSLGPRALSAVRRGGPRQPTLLCDVLFTEIGDAGAAVQGSASLRLQGLRIGGDLELHGIRVQGDAEISGVIDGALSFWDSRMFEELERAVDDARRVLGMARDARSDWLPPFEPVWTGAASRIRGQLILKGIRTGRNLNLSNLHMLAEPSDRIPRGSIDLSEAVIGGELRVRSSAPHPRAAGVEVPIRSHCRSLDLRMTQVSGNCILTGLNVGVEDAQETRRGPWGRLYRRLLGIDPQQTSTQAGGWLRARGMQVDGDIEMYRSSPPGTAEGWTRVQGLLDLHSVRARALVLSGHGFESDRRDVCLAYARITRLMLRKPFPAYVDMRGLIVDDWDLAEPIERRAGDFLEILDNTHPFDSNNYSQVEAKLRRSGDERRADEIYRALCEREFDERIGSITARKRDAERPVDGPWWKGARWTLGGWTGVYRNVALPAIILSLAIWTLHGLTEHRTVIELPAMILLSLVAAAVFQRWLMDGWLIFRKPKSMSGRAFAGAILFLPAVVLGLLLGHRSSYRGLAVVGLVFLGMTLVATVGAHLKQSNAARTGGVRVATEVHVWMRAAKWMARLMIRPIRGSLLLLTRLFTGYLTNPRPVVIVIGTSFVIAMSAFSVPQNFKDVPSPSALPNADRGKWNTGAAALYALEIVIPLIRLPDPETLMGNKSYHALRDGVYPYRHASDTGATDPGKGAGTFFKMPDGRELHWSLAWIGNAGGALLDRWGCRRVDRYEDSYQPVTTGRFTSVRACEGIRPSALARVLSIINWVTWPLLLLGFATRLRQRKSLNG